uniref:Uncharacterized protein n=1 Tax=Trichobilharzia regenti TaxID=157069 RepID=A0AA85JJJ4_TRIRE|nr:unnamed protein product [Trichobilharzia regenti]
MVIQKVSLTNMGRINVRNLINQPAVSKKSVFIKLDFRGDDTTKIINKRISAALSRTYPAAKLVSLLLTSSSMEQSKINKYLSYVISNCKYQFTSNIGRAQKAYAR